MRQLGRARNATGPVEVLQGHRPWCRVKAQYRGLIVGPERGANLGRPRTVDRHANLFAPPLEPRRGQCLRALPG